MTSVRKRITFALCWSVVIVAFGCGSTRAPTVWTSYDAKLDSFIVTFLKSGEGNVSIGIDPETHKLVPLGRFRNSLLSGVTENGAAYTFDIEGNGLQRHKGDINERALSFSARSAIEPSGSYIAAADSLDKRPYSMGGTVNTNWVITLKDVRSGLESRLGGINLDSIYEMAFVGHKWLVVSATDRKANYMLYVYDITDVSKPILEKTLSDTAYNITGSVSGKLFTVGGTLEECVLIEWAFDPVNLKLSTVRSQSIEGGVLGIEVNESGSKILLVHQRGSETFAEVWDVATLKSIREWSFEELAASY
jgi:hypothetical protein